MTIRLYSLLYLYDKDVSDSSKIRRGSIIEYVKSHPECDKQSVVEYCTKKGVGSRKTVLDEIKDLEEEGILDVHKEKQNSKNYKLTVKSENLLLTIPQDLEEIFIKFQKFVNIIKKLCEEKRKLHINGPPPYYENFKYYIIITIISSFPYRLIEIINEIFTFYFIIVLPKKLDDQYIVSKLYSTYFEYIFKMYTLISKELQYYISSYDLSSIRKSVLYQSYMESKKENCFSKVCSLARMCRSADIEKDLYMVLDLVWSKNKDVAILLYELDVDVDVNMIMKQVTMKTPDINTDKNDEILNKIHGNISC